MKMKLFAGLITVALCAGSMASAIGAIQKGDYRREVYRSCDAQTQRLLCVATNIPHPSCTPDWNCIQRLP